MQLVKTTSVAMAVSVIAFLCPTMSAIGQEEEGLPWPREITVPEATIVIYQPQLEIFEGAQLTARAAVSIKVADREEPVFGAVWFDATVNTDRDERVVTLESVKVSKAAFPNATPEQLARFSEVVTANIMGWDPEMSLDRLLTALETLEKRRAAAADLKTTPPKILFVTHPAVLVTIDGEPKLQQITGSSIMRVLNTPFVILYRPKTRSYFMTGGTEWLTTTDLTGKWELIEDPPATVKAVVASGEATPDPPAEPPADQSPDKRPQIIVVTEPTELISTDGSPEFTPIEGTGLLFMNNTDSDVVIDIDTQTYYTLLSGRWYSGKTMSGEWEYVASDQLPADFANIPEHSSKAALLASVSGTQAATDAINDTAIPQTSKIDRTATVTVTYDGRPKFEPITDTEMEYAINTESSVVRVGATYYCCDQGVWYCATKPSGPWTVCTEVPDEIYTIPPSCPVYNVTYVYVYESTPSYVYVGYYPGYVGCYVYGGTVVYGTGYVYAGWYGNRYYGRPATWGVGVRYNPWTGGWGVAVGYRGPYGGVAVVGRWGGGAVAYGYGGVGVVRRGGWWGPAGYRSDVDINRSVTTPFGTREIDTEISRRGNDIDIDRDVSFEPNQNLYDRNENRQRNIEDRSGARGDNAGDRRANVQNNRQNNVFADRDGNVHRRTSDGWQRRDTSGWTRPESRPNTRGTNRSNVQNRQRNLERSSQSRSRGTARTQNYQRSRSGGRSGGARRGGGRRR